MQFISKRFIECTFYSYLVITVSVKINGKLCNTFNFISAAKNLFTQIAEES